MKNKTTIISYGNINSVLSDIETAIEDIVSDTSYCPKLISTIEKEQE